MKLKQTLIVSALALGCSFASAQTPAEAPAAASPQYSEAQVLEAYGWYLGKSSGLAELGFSRAEVDSIVSGILLAHEGKDLTVDIQQIAPQIDTLLRTKQESYLAKLKEKSAADSEKLFAELKTKEGVTILDSGLAYEILKPGTGAYPTINDTVKVHYTGTLIDGTVFDSSLAPSQPGAAVEPVEFPLAGVVPGFSEGVQKINAGGKIKLYIPAALGYGDRPAGSIPPGSTLIFEVELLEIVPAAKSEQALPAVPGQPGN